MNKNFFGSKLNSILLLVLIILMIIAIWFMIQDKAKYLPILDQSKSWAEAENKAYDEYKKSILEKLSGNKEDFIDLSIAPDSKVHGLVSYRGAVKGGYFFEGNVLINILDDNKVALKKSNAIATRDWMTTEIVPFEGSIDFTELKKGNAYFEIQKDNPAGSEEGVNKSILIPIIIE
jgi:hypothetical protein